MKSNISVIYKSLKLGLHETYRTILWSSTIVASVFDLWKVGQGFHHRAGSGSLVVYQHANYTALLMRWHADGRADARGHRYWPAGLPTTERTRC